jgi:hypothetical protein
VDLYKLNLFKPPFITMSCCRPQQRERNPPNANAEKKDTLDSIFGWTERLMCPNTFQRNNTTPAAPEEDDLMDYVFQGVESFVCAEDVPASAFQQGGGFDLDNDNDNHSLLEYEQEEDEEDLDAWRTTRRVASNPARFYNDNKQQQRQVKVDDNSVVEYDDEDELVAWPATRTKQVATLGQTVPEDGDALDYVFNHVESFVCADQIPMGALENAPRAGVRVTPEKIDPRYDSDEEEIQLYFRPTCTH